MFLQAASGGIGSLLPFMAIIIVLYFFMIRPQVKRQKREKQFRSQIKKGLKVVTNGGIHGKVVEINDKDNTVVIETSAGKIKFETSAISMELSKKYTVQVKK